MRGLVPQWLTVCAVSERARGAVCAVSERALCQGVQGGLTRAMVSRPGVSGRRAMAVCPAGTVLAATLEGFHMQCAQLLLLLPAPIWFICNTAS